MRKEEGWALRKGTRGNDVGERKKNDVEGALDRTLAEEEPEHARDVPAAHSVARRLTRVEDAVDQLAGLLVELLVRARLLEDLERLNPRHHRHQGTLNRYRHHLDRRPPL